MKFTIVDLICEMGITPHKRITWAVGKRMAKAYKERFGTLPEKALHEKTSGQGSHCHAVYPIGMRPIAESLISARLAELAA